jgi:hypothetical protein
MCACTGTAILESLHLSALTSEETFGLVKFFSIIGGSILILMLVGYVVLRSRRERQRTKREKRLLFPETSRPGALKDLSALEAGMVMNVDVARLLTMYLLDLAAYGDIRIISHVDLKFEATAKGDIPEFRELFLAAIREDGSLDTDKALIPLDYVYKSLKQRLRTCSVKETADYYYEKVDSHWRKIEDEDPAEEKLDTLMECFPWLILHDNFDDLLEEKFKYSGYWPKVEPIGNMLRVIDRRLIKQEDLFRHFMHHRDGLLSAPFYKNDIMSWARWLVETHGTPPDTQAIEDLYQRPAAEEGAKKYHQKMHELALEAKELLEKTEQGDE